MLLLVQVERHLRAHGASFLAACVTLLLSLLLVHRGNQRAVSDLTGTSSQVIQQPAVIQIPVLNET
jgi:hypothetical protein